MLSRLFTWLGKGRGKAKQGRLLTAFQPKPPRSVPRERCEHRNECYLCPVDVCQGCLNPPDEPDVSKPRSSSHGRCLYFFTGDGEPMRIRVSMEGANEFHKRRILEQAERDEYGALAAHHRPGQVDVEIPDFLRAGKRGETE